MLLLLHCSVTIQFYTFSELVSILFRNVSKQLKHLDLVNFCHVSVRFNFFPYIIHCFSVSKHQKWGLVFSLFPELVSILFRNVSKQLKHMDLVNFCHVSVCFNFFPIQSIVSVFRNTRNGAWYFHFFQSLFQFCFETFRNN